MSKKVTATQKRMESCFAQIVRQEILGHKIAGLAAKEKTKARVFSYESQIYLLILEQFLHAFSLNKLVDLSQIHRKELSRIRGITAANLNTFSHANRTREDELFNSLGAGDVGIADRDNCFSALFAQYQRDVFFVVREKKRMRMRMEVVEDMPKANAACSYSRFAAIVKHIVWLKKDAMEILRSYGIAPPPNIDDEPSEMPYLPGFEKVFL